MPRFTVEVEETVTTFRRQTFTAATVDEARSKAEAEDWRAWPEIDSHNVDAAITDVYEVDPADG